MPGQSEGFWQSVRDSALDTFPSAEAAFARELDASLRIQATDNANALASVDPARLARAARAQAPLRELRLAKRWAITLWPTAAAAQQAGMGTRELEAFVDARAVPGPRRPRRGLGRAAGVSGGPDREACAGSGDPHPR